MDDLGFAPHPDWVAADRQAGEIRRRRRHRMVFTTRTVRSMVLRDPTRFVEVASEHGSPWFLHLWDTAGQARSVKELMDPGPMVVTVRSADDVTTIVVRLPPPEVEPEAHFIGILAHWDRAHERVTSTRYFALEHGLAPTTAEIYAVVCEWALDRHINYSVDVPVDELVFVRTIREIDREGTTGDVGLVLPDDDFRNLTTLAAELRRGP